MELSEKALEWAKDALFVYGPKIISALLVLLIGLWVIKVLIKGLRKFFVKKDFDPTLEKFLLNLSSWGLKIMIGCWISTTGVAFQFCRRCINYDI